MTRVLTLLPVLLALQVGVSPALAWTWPADGPVLRPFAFDPDSPYAGGQHRGIDVGAPAGTPVLAPAAGTVSFAGTVPGGGLTLAIRTPDGYSVTLVHLGAIGAAQGATVVEGGVVASVGPSGEPELPEPYVHLGIRIAAEPQGYVDPLSFLPARSGAPPTDASTSVDETPAPPEAGATGPAPKKEPAGETAAVDSGRAAAGYALPASRSSRTRQVPERSHAVRRPAGEGTGTTAPMSLEARLVVADRSLPTIVPLETSAAVAKPSPDGPGWVLSAVLLLAVSAGAAGLAAHRPLRDARVAQGATAVLSEPREACPDLDRNHDAALLDVADGPRRTGSPPGLCGHGRRGCSRPRRRRPTPLSPRSSR
jgi:hypothetical protein